MCVCAHNLPGGSSSPVCLEIQASDVMFSGCRQMQICRGKRHANNFPIAAQHVAFCPAFFCESDTWRCLKRLWSAKPSLFHLLCPNRRDRLRSDSMRSDFDGINIKQGLLRASKNSQSPNWRGFLSISTKAKPAIFLEVLVYACVLE